MKTSFITLLILIITYSAQAQGDSLMNVQIEQLQEQISDLKGQVETLKNEIEKTDCTDRGYITLVTALYTGSIVVISILVAFIVPANLRRKHRKFKKQVKKSFMEYKKKVDEPNITSTRTMYEMAVGQNSFMSVVWGGRRLKALFDSELDVYHKSLQRDITIILEQIERILTEIFTDNQRKQLATFENLGGVIKNFQLIISSHKDSEIKRLSSSILTTILTLKKSIIAIKMVSDQTDG